VSPLGERRAKGVPISLASGESGFVPARHFRLLMLAIYAREAGLYHPGDVAPHGRAFRSDDLIRRRLVGSRPGAADEGASLRERSLQACVRSRELGQRG